MKKTKIVATIGPATSSYERLNEIINEGVDVIRLNFSHGTHDDHASVIKHVRKINDETENNIALLADLQGPKLRIDTVKDNGIELEDGKEIIISTIEVVGTPKKISTNYQMFAKDVNVDEEVRLDDGKIHLRIVKTNKKDEVVCEIVHGGILSSKKGINLPNTNISLPCLTKKDLIDLDFALEQDVDWIGLSFVRTAEDIKELKDIIAERKKHALVIAKIEKPEALDVIDDIIDATDAVMVARGDLGVEIPMQNVPLVQKMLVKKCQQNSKPVIVATQMMESMISNITPTRAEVNDVANAVLDGTDAVMLSGETSVGKFPVDVIKSMVKIIDRVEDYDNVYYHETPPAVSAEDRFVSDSICYNACRLSKRVGAKAISTMTFSGYTGMKVSSQRPKANIFVFTGNKKILTLMNLVWGVKAFYYDKMVSTDHTIADIKYILKKKKMVQDEDLIINIASMPIAEQGMSNMLKLSKA